MRVAIIGSGNVATVIGRLALNSEHVVVHVASRDPEHAALLAKELDASHSGYNEVINAHADLFIVAVADAAIEESIQALRSSNKFIVHTAGAVSKNILKNISDSYGVLYPLQSLRKERLPLEDVPFLVDGNTEEVREAVTKFALTLSNDVSHATDLERLKHHAAAVIVNNFTNHLYTLTEEFCKRENIAFEKLLPLIKETTSRLDKFSPSVLQTGPAFRKDNETMNKHLDIFQDYPALKKIYETFSESIMKHA
jgi:predicted short-subunit dehydrogenase-like oxidoreductase (DUF2520 family)